MPKLFAIILVLLGGAAGGAGGYFAKQTLAAGAGDGDHGEETHESDGGKEGDDGHGGKADKGHADKGHADKGHADKGHAEKGKAGGDKKAKKGGDGKSGHGKADDGGAYGFNDGVNYFKFSRQFVIPIVEESGVRSLVLLDLNLEMDASAAESFYVREPKLRDALMEELLAIANEGRFDGVLTDRRNLELVRIDLLNAVQDVEGDSVHDVLILDIMRQDF